MHALNVRLLVLILGVGSLLANGRAAPGVGHSLPMDLKEAMAADGGALDAPPQVIKLGEGDYPGHLIDNGIYSGWVISSLQIDAEGRVVEAKVIFASHPGFVRPALSRVLASKFSAARRNNQPVLASGQLISTFVALSRLGLPLIGGIQRIPGKIPGLPVDYDYDVPPKLKKFCEPAYPRHLLENEAKGEAAVRFILDDKGLVVAGEILEATHPDFGAALLAAVETWTFDPATRNGVATKTVIETKQKFLPYGFRRSTPETAVLKELKKGGKKIQQVENLDRLPKAIYRIEPQYPRALLASKTKGAAEIEAIIHETGEVTLPTVVSASRPEFGWAALNAVQQWVFEVPQVKGKPVSVRMRIPLAFEP